MNIKKIVACISAVSIMACGSWETWNGTNGFFNDTKVEAMMMGNGKLKVSMNDNMFYIAKGETITKAMLEKSGIKVTLIADVYNDFPEDSPLCGTTTYEGYSEDVTDSFNIIIPDELISGENIITITASAKAGPYSLSNIKTEIPINVCFENKGQEQVTYKNFTGEFDSYVQNDYDSIYNSDDGKYYQKTTLKLFKPYIPENEIVNVTVPSEINEQKIFTIGSYSCDCTKINALTLSSGIMSVSGDAFNNTETLKFLTVPESVTSIEDNSFDKDITIKGYIGSYAEAYAYRSGYRFEGIGDINNDGKFSVSDMIPMQKYMYNIPQTDMTIEDRADLNMDSDINILDYVLLKNNILEEKTSAISINRSAVVSPDLNTVKRSSQKIEADGFDKFVADSAGLVLFDTKDEKGSENPVYSPISVYMALSQAAEGADKNTLDEILKALNAENIEELRESNVDLFKSLYYDNWDSFFKIANSIWINNKYKVEKDALDNLAKYFYSASFVEDFTDHASEKKISDWISNNTGGKFKPDIKNHEDDILKIINTVNFKDQWIDGFGEPVKDTFYTVNGDEIDCDFLKKTEENGMVGFGENYKKYSVPMKNNYKMNFVLPDKDVTVNQIVSDKDTMTEIINNDMKSQKAKVIFSVPQFKTSSKYDLIPVAKKLGINDAFEATKCDFNKIINYKKNNIKGAYISEITHEAALSIDKKGCEAAAYTIIAMKETAAMPGKNEEVYFELDRPFYYYVSDNNGTPVFAGVINKPVNE